MSLRNVIYVLDNNSQIPLAGIANLPYTDVILAFLYPDGNGVLQLGGGVFNVPIESLQSDIGTLQKSGKNVLISFGGSGVLSAGYQSWTGNVNALVKEIVFIVNTFGFNGIDIDYEDNNGFTGEYDGIKFLSELTSGLAKALPGHIITHAPQAAYWDGSGNQFQWATDPVAPYAQIWQQVGNQITWINNQFYNTPYYDKDAATKINWYNIIAATTGPQKLLVGAPLQAAGFSSGYLTLDDITNHVIQPLKGAWGPQFGGVMGWQFSFDQGGAWANGIGEALADLFVFHQGVSSNGQLWYSVFDGLNWTEDRRIQPLGISESPSAVRWKDGITVFHQGSSYNEQLWYSYSGDGLNWDIDKPVPNLGMSGSPSAVVSNGNLYVFHQGGGSNGQLWYSVFDGTNWTEDRQIQPLGMSSSPSAVAWAGGITVFHQGGGNNGQLWYSYSSDGVNWGTDTLVQNVNMSGSPSAVVYNGLLYVFYQGGSGYTGQLWYSVFDGTNWGQNIVRNVGMSGSPSATAWAGGMTVFHQGDGNNGQLWYSYFNGRNWGTDTLIQPLGMSGSPSAVVL